MYTYKNIFLTAMMFFIPFANLIAEEESESQNGIGSDDIVVRTTYTPLIADATKVTFSASIESEKIEPPTLRYSLPVQLIPVTYEQPNIRPIAIPQERPQPGKSSYARLGFGTQLSPLVEVLYTGGQTERFTFGGYFNHHSARGGMDFQTFGKNNIHFFTDYFFDRIKIDARAGYNNHIVHYYGFPEDSVFNKSDVRQSFNEYFIEANLRNTKDNRANIDYYLGMSADYFTDRYDATEVGAKVYAKFHKTFRNKHYIDFIFSVDHVNFESPTTDYQKNLIAINPHYTFFDESWRLTAGLNGTFEGNVFHLFPHLSTEKTIIGQQVIFYNGWKRYLDVNRYKFLAEENYFIDNDLEIKNPRIEERFAGFKGTVINNLAYDARFTQKIVENQPLFVNNPNNIKKFNTIYEKRMNIVNLHASVSYHLSNKLNFLLEADYYRHELDEEEKAWHMPSFKMKFATGYNIGDKIILSSEIYGVDGVYAKLPNDEALKLNGLFDLNIGATYHFSNHLSFFGQVNNIASIKHERWYRYPTYGFNAMIGATLSY
ncbi:MAG: hypothetical protein EA412_13820 [Chitinophagaceae bacterium]|nr:MAG: hypothetical protein EA412_13820 [Chitinophagaceae bacterium]